MGSYLSEPATEKVSTDESSDKLNCGASSMQGWRVNQEDAHNCLLSFDENTSLFAVYDGHGGHEVALYCSQKLPQFLKNVQAYQTGNLESALIDAFLGFDATITTKDVIDELKAIAGDKEAVEESDEENVDNLYEEAAMPIEQVIEKYAKFSRSSPHLKHLNDEKAPASPFLRAAKENDSVVGTSSSSGSSSCVPEAESVSDGVSSSSSVVNEASSANHVEENISEANSTNGMAGESDVKAASPDSSDVKEAITSSKSDGDSKPNAVESSVNGDLSVPDGGNDVKSDVTSSSTVQENGSKKGKGKGKALNKTKGVVISTPEVACKRPSRNAKQLYKQLLDFEESDDCSEDEEDKTFEGPYDASSDEENGGNTVLEESDSSDDGVEEEEDEEDEDDESEDVAFTHNMKEEPGSDSGCTAVVALLRGNELYVANAGDSRCIVCRNGQAVEMSFDHKPEDDAERQRIEKAGGRISADGRVNGGLNLSRAIGDHAYKQNKELSDKEQMITALPDVRTLTINPGEDEFMVLACDGIWNFMSSQNVVDFVRERIGRAEKLSKICEELFDHCLAPHTRGDGTGCDNMTAIIVQFKSNIMKRAASDSPESSDASTKRTKTEESDSRIDTTA